MTLQDDMRESWERDQRDERQMKDLLLVLKDFLEDPPARMLPYTKTTMDHTIANLERDCALIVSVWS